MYRPVTTVRWKMEQAVGWASIVGMSSAAFYCMYLFCGYCFGGT